MKLQSTTDFVLQIGETYLQMVRYAKFLKTPLNKGMFVPCDLEGNVLEEPNISEYKSTPFCESGECKAYFEELNKHQQAKERVLFDGYEVLHNAIVQICGGGYLDESKLKGKTIESLVGTNLELTESAIKQFM